MMLDEMPGGAFVASLASVRDPGAVLGAVTGALDLRGANGDPDSRIVARVRGRPTLIVLDNFEQLLAAAPVVGGLVSRAPELRVLVTSQAALRVAGEVVMGLDALELDAAADLFVQLAQAVAPRWSPTAEERQPIVEICRRVGCLPLAIELAAARASVLDPKELLARLERSSELLRGGARDAPERQQSLRATFRWTHGLLQGAQRVLFRRLGVFAGPVALQTIEAVCEIQDDDQSVVALDALEGLIEFSLVARDQAAVHGTRFTMAQALREFAEAELTASGEEQQVRRRHAEHLAAVAGEARVWFSADSEACGRVLALEAEIRPALQWAVEHDAELYRRLVAALALGLIRRGQIREALDHTTRARAGFEAPHDEIDAWLGNCRAYALLMSGRLDEATSAIEPVIAFHRALGDSRYLGLALHTAGWIANEPGRDRPLALALSRESLELLRSTGDPALAGRGVALLIQVLIYMNALEDAERLLAQAAASITDPESDLANAVATLSGDVALARGDAATALAHFVGSLKLAARRSDGIQIVNDSHCVAHALALTGRPEAALEAAGAAAAIAADSGHAVQFADIEAEIDAARNVVGSAAADLIARGRNLEPGERVARVLALALGEIATLRSEH
jgi:predicted ATPase